MCHIQRELCQFHQVKKLTSSCHPKPEDLQASYYKKDEKLKNKVWEKGRGRLTILLRPDFDVESSKGLGGREALN